MAIPYKRALIGILMDMLTSACSRTPNTPGTPVGDPGKCFGGVFGAAEAGRWHSPSIVVS
jgi:hypothetical protein